MAKEQKSGIFTSVTDIFLHLKERRNGKAITKGLDNSGKPASAFNAFKR